MEMMSTTDDARVFLSATAASRARARAFEFELWDSGRVERAQRTDDERDRGDEQSAGDEERPQRCDLRRRRARRRARARHGVVWRRRAGTVTVESSG
jgi:hypothetical protein